MAELSDNGASLPQRLKPPIVCCVGCGTEGPLFNNKTCNSFAGNLTDNVNLLLVAGIDFVVVIRFPGYDWLGFKVVSRRRRRRLPLQSRSVPRIIRRRL